VKKRTRRKQNKKSFKLKNKHGILILIVVALLTFAALIVFAYQFKTAIETPKTEVKKLPADVKKFLKQLPPQKLAATIRVPILFYHYVEYVQDKKDTIRQSLNITPNVFEQQIQTLVNADYSFMTAKELGEVLDGKRQLPKNPILLTFDDGHWDFDTVVLPILEKYHVKATAYIIPGFLGGSDFMSQEQLQEVISSGLVDVGAHTVHHVELARKLFPVVDYEVKKSKTMLEQTYHINVVSFAYPSGSFDKQAINVVKNAGFTTAVSTLPGVVQSQQNRFFLYRLRPGYRTGQYLLNYLQQNYFGSL
jgi:peptidoglycan/xylan/chitin deacetylase (PgdA/CDA1 family)